MTSRVVNGRISGALPTSRMPSIHLRASARSRGCDSPFSLYSDWLARLGAGEFNRAATLGVCERAVNSPTGFGHSESRDILRTRKRNRTLARKEVGGIGPAISGPEHHRGGHRIRWPAMRGLPQAGERKVVLKVSAHARQVRNDRDPQGPQTAFVTDAGQHQDLGGVHRAQGEHDLGMRDELPYLAAERGLDSRCPIAVDGHAAHVCV